MKIKFGCRICFIEGKETYDSVQVGNDDLYHYTCSRGHKNIYFLKNEKFELLIESAVYAIIDGYYREAISSMTSSFERLYEFVLKIIYQKNGLYSQPFEKVWKEVSKQSERQLGGFLFLFFMEYRRMPDSLTGSERNMRNNVIHKGKFPTYDETIKYCQRILDMTYNILEIVRGRDEQILTNMINDKHDRMMEEFEKMNVRPFTHVETTAINLNHSIHSFKRTDLIGYIKEIKSTKYESHR